MPFLGDADKVALTDAVSAIEARSSAEVVVLVRPQSGSYRDADLIAGIAFGLLVLWFQLFSPWEFSLLSILVAPVAGGAVAALLVSRAPAARRALTRPATRRQAVLTAARAAFVEHGVDGTSGRTGLLVYVSLLERIVEVVADRGVVQAVPADEWESGVDAVRAAVAKGQPGRVLAGHLVTVGDLLAASLPRAEGDVDELVDEVVA